MSSKVLVTFGTMTGTTREVAEAIGAELRAGGHAVEVARVDEAKSIDDFDAVVAGTPVMIGMLNGPFRKFMRRNAKKLASKKVAWFLVCGYMNEPTDENVNSARKRVDSISGLVPDANPLATAMFGGAIKTQGSDFERLNPFLKFMSGKIAADMKDGRDWNAIKAWARHLAAKL
ncbi:MAG: hypothetical protein GF418_12585 [Chitinivibrionales bacterium]|nr:hypothetical protein [Chitinivibrionales bacterium]MBD3396456.1 hypothetical protein [Chitinivibrionales bacterium]